MIYNVTILANFTVQIEAESEEDAEDIMIEKIMNLGAESVEDVFVSESEANADD